MGMSVGAILLDIDRLKTELIEKVPKADVSVLEKALPHFGEIHNNMLLTVNCDYWDQYDPYFGLMKFIERYYDTDLDYEIVKESVIASVDSGADPDDVADEMGIELPEKEEE